MRFDKTEEVLQTESSVRKAILEGVDPQQAYFEIWKVLKGNISKK